MRDDNGNGGQRFSGAVLALLSILSALLGVLVGAMVMHVNILERVAILEQEMKACIAAVGGS